LRQAAPVEGEGEASNLDLREEDDRVLLLVRSARKLGPTALVGALLELTRWPAPSATEVAVR
jgi:hypothetical protein